jgi:hypothetical protein
MARETKMPYDFVTGEPIYLEKLKAFEALVRADERALAAPVQEPVAWKWHQAPVKTSWGHEMVVADVAIDKDNTVSVYCERDQTTKVEAMFTPPAAQRPFVGLTDEEINGMVEVTNLSGAYYYDDLHAVARATEAKLKEKK